MLGWRWALGSKLETWLGCADLVAWGLGSGRAEECSSPFFGANLRKVQVNAAAEMDVPKRTTAEGER